jgi:hypothetical protein
MAKKELSTVVEHFSRLTDPRIDHKKRHQLLDIVVIAICAVICGANDWVGIEAFGNAKYEWLKMFLELPNGIPSHDTFGRVFSLISPIEFQNCFKNWIHAVVKPGRVHSMHHKRHWSWQRNMIDGVNGGF